MNVTFKPTSAGKRTGSLVIANSTTSVPTSLDLAGTGVLASCALKVSTQIQVTRGGYRRNSTTGRYVQQVTLKNTGASAITGPVALVLDGVSSNATLFAPSGTTSCATPVSPFVTINVGPDNVLSVGETASVVLEFTNPTNTSVNYTARVLAGTNR